MSGTTSDWELLGTEDAPAATAPAPTAAPTPATPQAWQLLGTHPVAGPSGNLLTDAGRIAGTGLVNAAAGMVSLPRTVAQGVDWLGGLVGHNPGADAALASIPHPVNNDYPLFPDFQTAREAMFAGPGLSTGGTEYAPTSWLGRRALDATTMAIPALAAPETLIPSALGGATAGQAAELVPGHPFLASTLGFLLGGKIGQGLQNAPQRVAAAALNASPSEPFGAFSRLGLPTELGGTVTGDPGLSWAEKFGARMPGSEDAILDARQKLVDAWQGALDRTALTMGKAGTAQEAGQSLQTAANDWVDQFKNQQAARWGLFKLLVPPNTQVPVNNFQSELNGVLHDFGGADNLAKTLQPQLAAKLKTALRQDISANGTLPWQAVQSTRTALGEMLENPQPVADMAKSAIKRLYGGLSQDMEAGANASGPQAAAAFRQASDVTRTGHGILDQFLNPILTAETPEKATQAVLSQARLGGTRLQGVVDNLPSASGDLSAYALRNAAGAGDGSPTSFGTAIAGRKPVYSPEAMRALFPNAADQQTVADLAATGRAMQPFEKDLANSPTATHQTRGIGRLITALELGKVGGEFAGWPGRVAGFSAGLFAPNAMGRAAQATALNPMLSALYGRPIPMQGALPPFMLRTAISPALLPQSGAVPFGLSAPATSANSGTP